MSFWDQVGETITASIGLIVSGFLAGALWVLRVMLTNQREIELLKHAAEEDREQRKAMAARIDLLVDKLIK